MLCMGSYRRRRRAEIVLDYNRLTSVPAKLLQLPALKKLSLQHNFITQLDAESVAACGAKLSSVQLDGNPLAYPPTAIALKGWSTVKKWMPANPSFVTYRMYVPAVPSCQFEMTCAHSFTKDEGDFVRYVDINYCAMRDTMVSSKDEDRDATYILPIGATEAVRLV